MHPLASEEIDRIEGLCAALVAALRAVKTAEDAFEPEETLYDDWLGDHLGEWWRVKPGIEDAYPRWHQWRAVDLALKRAIRKAAKAFNDVGRAVDPDEFVGELPEEWESDDN